MVGALAALGLAAAVLLRRKGTASHVRLGRWYVAVMAVQLAAALGTREQAAFGPFHVLAVVSAVTLTGGLVARWRGDAPAHGAFMTWSVAGLVAAGLAQWATAAAPAGAPWTVVVTSLAVVAATAVLLRCRRA